MLTFPELIIVYRKRAKLSQADLAARLDWAQSKISRLETSDKPPNSADLLALCTELQIPVADAMRAVGHAVGAA